MNTFSAFRKVAFWEGISYLVLLLIAMPLKYIGGNDLAVKYVGMAHGVLFVAYIVLAIWVKMFYNKNFLWLAKAFFVSLIPFGTFYMEPKWKKEQLSSSLT